MPDDVHSRRIGVILALSGAFGAGIGLSDTIVKSRRPCVAILVTGTIAGCCIGEIASRLVK